MIVINLFSSILLAKYIGITGIFIGTLLSRLLTVGIFDPYIVFKYGLKISLQNYYKAHGFYHIVTLIVGTLLFLLFSKWLTTTALLWIIKAVCVFVTVNLIYVVIFFRHPLFMDLKLRISEIMGKVLNGTIR